MACCSRYFYSIFLLTMILMLDIFWPARFCDSVWAADPDPRTFTLSEIAYSPDPSQTDFTLDECVRRTLELSPAMSSAHQTIEGAEWDKKQALTNFLPKAGLSYSYTRLDERPMSSGFYVPPFIVVPPKPAGTVDNISLVTSISQPIFNGFSLISQYDLASLGLDLAVINLLRSKLDIILQVKQAYFTVLEAQRSLEVAEQSVKQLEEHLKVATSFFEVGLTPKIDVLQAEVQLAQAVQDQTVAEHQLIYAKAALNVLLRRQMEAPLTIEDVKCQRPIEDSADPYITRAYLCRPEVTAAQTQIDMSEENIRLARSGYFPNINLVYNHIRESDKLDTSDSRYHDNSWNIVATASWTFWDWGKTYKGVQSKKVEVIKARNAMIQIKDAVSLEVKKAFLSLLATKKNIEVSEKALQQAEENYRMSQERYREQVAASTEVTDAQTLLTQARTNKNRASYQYCLAWATLERAIGLDIY